MGFLSVVSVEQGKQEKIRLARCDQCGWIWLPKSPTSKPSKCPLCESKFWNEEPEAVKIGTCKRCGYRFNANPSGIVELSVCPWCFWKRYGRHLRDRSQYGRRISN